MYNFYPLFERILYPIPTRLCYLIYWHDNKSYPCLVGIGLTSNQQCKNSSNTLESGIIIVVMRALLWVLRLDDLMTKVRTHFFQRCCHFQYNISLPCLDFSKNDNIFERNENCATVVLKLTDFRKILFPLVFYHIKKPNWAGNIFQLKVGFSVYFWLPSSFYSAVEVR